MIGSKLIAKFEEYVDDGTELSATQELELLNKAYRDVYTAIPWEFTKKEYSVAVSGTTSALPSDFSEIAVTTNESLPQRIVWVGTEYYTLINFSERKRYSDKSGYCWLDIVNDNLVFSTSVSGTLTYDYIFYPEDLTLSTEPAFPSVYHDVLYHLMAVDDYAIQQFDKARSYAKENQEKADYWLLKMKLWNANLTINLNYE